MTRRHPRVLAQKFRSFLRRRFAQKHRASHLPERRSHDARSPSNADIDYIPPIVQIARSKSCEKPH